MNDKEPIVWIFYSSTTEPELLTFYADGLAYLKDHNIGLEVIDISEDSKKAKEFGVTTTPTVLIEKNGVEKERYEIVSYLNGVLESEELKRIFEES